jgi:membrane fusion protein (multidrug efflux system)
VLATVKDGSNALVPGSFAKVKLIMGTNNAAVSIPSMAIIPSARSKQVIVYRDSLPVFIDVTTGIRSEDNVQITSGLSVGDTIVTTGLLFIRKDSKLKLSKVQ